MSKKSWKPPKSLKCPNCGSHNTGPANENYDADIICHDCGEFIKRYDE